MVFGCSLWLEFLVVVFDRNFWLQYLVVARSPPVQAAWNFARVFGRSPLGVYGILPS